jgi:micrococcal nuclease
MVNSSVRAVIFYVGDLVPCGVQTKYSKQITNNSRFVVGLVCLAVACVVSVLALLRLQLPAGVFGASTNFSGEPLVVRIVDGDTVVLSTGQKIRYIGMDTPELKRGDCYAAKARDRNKELVLNKFVQLKKDISETDKFGRLLRYVFVDGGMVNEVLVREGYARAKTFPPDVANMERFLMLEQTAKAQNRGLWRECSK